MKQVFSALLDHQERGEGCMLVSAVGGEGSAPRKMQSHMLVDAAGRVCGTVGGGAVEGRSISYARLLIEKRESALETYELFEHVPNDIGMICGGRVQVHFQWIAPDDTMVKEIACAGIDALLSGENAWLIVDVNRHRLLYYAGERMIVGEVPDEIISKLGKAPFTCAQDATTYYAEQLASSDRVYIFGGGHVAQALVPMLSSVEFRCVVIEDRKEFCQRALFPHAHDVVLLQESAWKEALHIGCDDCICIMTRGHQNDLACQAFALNTDAGYIGVIGSRRKIASVNAQLRNMGFGEDDIRRIVTPIGLEIDAVTPAEIAVSITAQMIAHRARRRKEIVKKSCMA